MSNEQRVIPLAGLEPKIVQQSDKGLAQLVVNKTTGALLVEGLLTVNQPTTPVTTPPTQNGQGLLATGTPAILIPTNSARTGFSVQNLDTDNSVLLSGTGFAITIPPECLYENHPKMQYTGDVLVASVTNSALVYGFEIVGG